MGVWMNNGRYLWLGKEKPIPIPEMTTDHLLNSLRMTRRHLAYKEAKDLDCEDLTDEEVPFWVHEICVRMEEDMALSILRDEAYVRGPACRRIAENLIEDDCGDAEFAVLLRKEGFLETIDTRPTVQAEGAVVEAPSEGNPRFLLDGIGEDREEDQKGTIPQREEDNPLILKDPRRTLEFFLLNYEAYQGGASTFGVVITCRWPGCSFKEKDDGWGGIELVEDHLEGCPLRRN